MTRAMIFLAASALSSPALALQGAPAGAAPTSAAVAGCTPEHAAMGHCKLPEPAPQPAPAATGCTPEHAAMGHCTMPKPSPAVSDTPRPSTEDPSCPPEHAAMGHCTPMVRPGATAVARGPAPAAALAGPAHAADAVWGGEAMARSRAEMAAEHGDVEVGKLLVDRAEARVGKGSDAYLLDLQAWYGGDIDKLWLKGEVEGERGGSPEAEVQALWSRAIGPWFDLQAGLRHDFRHGPDRSHLALAVQGLAPYWWEVEGALFLSTKGEVTARAEAEYDLRVTQRLVLQPRIEANLSLQDIPELALGSGLTSGALGVRLRYQVSPLVAPYVGVEYERQFGDTRRFRQAGGEDTGGLAWLAGVRLWF